MVLLGQFSLSPGFVLVVISLENTPPMHAHMTILNTLQDHPVNLWMLSHQDPTQPTAVTSLPRVHCMSSEWIYTNCLSYSVCCSTYYPRIEQGYLQQDRDTTQTEQVYPQTGQGYTFLWTGQTYPQTGQGNWPPPLRPACCRKYS